MSDIDISNLNLDRLRDDWIDAVRFGGDYEDLQDYAKWYASMELEEDIDFDYGNEDHHEYAELWMTEHFPDDQMVEQAKVRLDLSKYLINPLCPDCNEDMDAHDLRGGDACPEKEPVSLENIVQDVDDAVWNVVVKHFPLAKSGDFDPLESGIWTESIRRAVTHWWTFNASEFYELNKDGE